MQWNVEFLKSARKSFLDLPQKFRFQIAKKIAVLENDPFPPGSEKMSGPEPLYRIRSGDYRVTYTVDRESRTILIVGVRHRREVYR
jgi:mRNA interferase RelE/StbE